MNLSWRTSFRAVSTGCKALSAIAFTFKYGRCHLRLKLGNKAWNSTKLAPLHQRNIVGGFDIGKWRFEFVKMFETREKVVHHCGHCLWSNFAVNDNFARNVDQNCSTWQSILHHMTKLLFWHNISFVVIYAISCGAKIYSTFLSVEQKLQIWCMVVKCKVLLCIAKIFTYDRMKHTEVKL